MAGSQIVVVASQITAQRLGYQAISLSHMSDTSEPKIAAGSKIEIGGALFEFTAEESITGWAAIAADSSVYIKLVVAGAAVTAEFTTTAPTWDVAKQGWYDGSDRYVAGLIKDVAAAYRYKWMFPTNDEAFLMNRIKLDIGNWNMDTTGGLALPHYLTAIVGVKPITCRVIIMDDTSEHAFPLDMGDGAMTAVEGSYCLFPTTVSMSRRSLGQFDSVNFDTAVFNRGWVFIEYGVL